MCKHFDIHSSIRLHVPGLRFCIFFFENVAICLYLDFAIRVRNSESVAKGGGGGRGYCIFKKVVREKEKTKHLILK